MSQTQEVAAELLDGLIIAKDVVVADSRSFTIYVLVLGDATQRVALAIEKESFVGSDLVIAETYFGLYFVEYLPFLVADGHHCLIEIGIL